MAETLLTARVEPPLEAATSPAARPPSPEALIQTMTPKDQDLGLDQLSRIEDKAARIEEKYARTEAQMLRLEGKVEQSTTRAGELARQADLAALRSEVGTLAGRTRRLPGFGALLVTALLTALLAAGLTLAALRYGVPGLLPPLIVGAPAAPAR